MLRAWRRWRIPPGISHSNPFSLLRELSHFRFMAVTQFQLLWRIEGAVGIRSPFSQWIAKSSTLTSLKWSTSRSAKFCDAFFTPFCSIEHLDWCDLTKSTLKSSSRPLTYNVAIRWWRRRWRRRSIISWHPLKSTRAKRLGYVFHSMKHEARMWRGSVRSNDITGSSGVFSLTSSLRLLLRPKSPFDQVIISESWDWLSRAEATTEERQRRHAALEAALREVITQVLLIVNEKKDHIPPVSQPDLVVSFPFEISIPSSGDSSFGMDMFKRMLQSGPPTMLNWIFPCTLLNPFLAPVYKDTVRRSVDRSHLM